MSIEYTEKCVKNTHFTKIISKKLVLPVFNVLTIYFSGVKIWLQGGEFMILSSGIEAKMSLKACRINVKASVKEMAMSIGVAESTIYKWESGISSPGVFHLEGILNFFVAKGFPVTVNDINFLP